MTSSLPVRACRYLIYVVRRWSQYAIYFIRRFVVYIARYVAWQWSWLTMNPTLQDVVAERNAAIRLAMEAQTTVHRLREQVSQLENIATSESIEQELYKLSQELSLRRNLLGTAQKTNVGDSSDCLKYQRLERAAATHRRLKQEIELRRKEIQDIRISLAKNDEVLGKEASS